MTEFLLEKESLASENSTKNMSLNANIQTEESSAKSNLFAFDIVSDTLKHIYTKSKIRKQLSSILSTLYLYPLLILFFSFLIGSLFFGLSMLFIYLRIINNIMTPVIFLIFLSLFFSILLIIIHVVDDIKNKVNIGAKWERKNILKNFGLSLTLITLVIGAFLFHKFFNKISYYSKNNYITVDYSDYSKHNESNYEFDFIFEYIVNCFIFEDNGQINGQNKINIYFSDSTLLKNLHKSFMISFIPLFIFCTTKIIKIILIEVKYTIAKMIVFLNYFFLIILIFVSHRFLGINEKKKEWPILSLIEIIILSFIYIGYILWTANSVFKLNKNPKDKNFSIYKYDLGQLILIFCFDIINMVGSSFIYVSLLINYISYRSNEIKYKDIQNTFFCLKTGFLLCIISNSYYYGHHLLALIFRPIALQYAPPKLKQYYIRANRNLSSFVSSKM